MAQFTPNTLYYGDNLHILRDFPPECVDLVYLDPPFNSNRSYNVLFKEAKGTESEAQIEAFGDAWSCSQTSASSAPPLRCYHASRRAPPRHGRAPLASQPPSRIDSSAGYPAPSPAPFLDPRRWLAWSPVLATLALGLPAIVVRITAPDLPVEAEALIFGLGILAAAFLLGASAEAAQHDIPASLALAVLAFIAVLPEYAVDLVFAWRAADDPSQAHFAVANMTGGNRLLLGVGWAFVLVVFAWRANGARAFGQALVGALSDLRGRGADRAHEPVLHLPRHVHLDIAVLGIATLYSVIIPIRGSITLIDSVVLLALFGFYLFRLAQHPVQAPEVGGPAAMLAHLPRWRRRGVVALLLAYAAGVIVASAEPFADGLIETGTSLGVDEFLLVQWVAPLASESPEFLAALYMVWRGAAAAGMTALISSKVNQWTLLIASLPIAYGISGETLSGLSMDLRQQEEVLLTAAQSMFGVLLILDRRLTLRAGLVLFTLFIAQFLVTDSTVRWGFAGTYLGLALIMLARQFRLVPGVLHDALRGAHDGPTNADSPESEPARF